MFLHTLTKNQGKAFMSLAERLVSADGLLIEAEADMIRLMAREIGIDPCEDPIEGTIEGLTTLFDTQQARTAALLELIGLGYVDTSFTAEESQLIKTVAASFGISDSKVSMMSDWVQRQFALVAEADRLLRDE